MDKDKLEDVLFMKTQFFLKFVGPLTSTPVGLPWAVREQDDRLLSSDLTIACHTSGVCLKLNSIENDLRNHRKKDHEGTKQPAAIKFDHHPFACHTWSP